MLSQFVCEKRVKQSRLLGLSSVLFSGLLKTGLFLSAICFSLSVHAQQPEDTQVKPVEEEYGDLIHEAETCFVKSQFACCAENFQRAYDLLPSPVLLYNTALCLDEDNRCEEAVRRYRDLIESTKDPTKQAEVRGRIERCVARSAALTFAISPSSSLVFVDGAQIDASLLDRGFLLTPGRHQLKVTSSGYQPQEKTILVAAGETVSIDVQLKKQTGNIAVNCDEADWTIFVDQTAAGTCPFVGEYDLGSYEVRVVNQDQEEVLAETVTVGPSFPAVIYIKPPKTKSAILPKIDPIEKNTDDMRNNPARNKTLRITSYLAMGLGGAALISIGVTDLVKFAPAREAAAKAKSADSLYENSDPAYIMAARDQEAEKAKYDEWVKNPGRITLYSIGGTLFLGGGILFLYNTIHEKKDEKESPPGRVQATPGGVRVLF